MIAGKQDIVLDDFNEALYKCFNVFYLIRSKLIITFSVRINVS